MKKKVYRHIGYYSDEDALALSHQNADYIVAVMITQTRLFHATKGESESDIEDVNAESDRNQFEKTLNGDYLVRYQNGCSRGEGWYIDIYKLTEIDESFEDTTEEYCSECGSTITLPAEFKIHVCPECGKHLVPCNLCPLDESRNCTKCPLSVLAEKLNENDECVETTIADFVKAFNNADNAIKQNGFILTLPYKREFYFHYNEELYDMCILLDLDNGGKAYTFKGNTITPHQIELALLYLTDLPSPATIRVKEN